jgi:hypothetical protein
MFSFTFIALFCFVISMAELNALRRQKIPGNAEEIGTKLVKWVMEVGKGDFAIVNEPILL